jgi:hypothetical protein
MQSYPCLLGEGAIIVLTAGGTCWMLEGCVASPMGINYQVSSVGQILGILKLLLKGRYILEGVVTLHETLNEICQRIIFGL